MFSLRKNAAASAAGLKSGQAMTEALYTKVQNTEDTSWKICSRRVGEMRFVTLRKAEKGNVSVV